MASEIDKRLFERQLLARQRIEEAKSDPENWSDPDKLRAIEKAEKTLQDDVNVILIAHKKRQEMASWATASKPEEPMKAEATPASTVSKNRVPFQKPASFSKDDIIKYLTETDKIAGLAPGTSAGMIDVESKFNPKARSQKGALGIAQIMPSTLKSLIERFKRRLNPFNIGDGLLMHREMMRENMSHFGNEQDAITAYNAGWNKEKFTASEEARTYFDKVNKAREQYANQPQNSTVDIVNKKLL